MTHQFKRSSQIEQNFRKTKDYHSLYQTFFKQMLRIYNIEIDINSRRLYDDISSISINKAGVDVSYTGFHHNTKRRVFIRIDEKFRYKWYGDILLETISNDQTHKIGWALDESKQNDFILYVIVPEQRCFVWLQKAILRGLKEKTITSIKTYAARNETYNTINISVSIDDIIKHKGFEFHYA